MGKKAIVIAIVLVGTIAFLFAPIIRADEPYTTMETHSRPLRHRVVSSKDEEIWNTREGYGFLPMGGITHISEVIVENLDECGGTFKVTHCWEDKSGKSGKRQISEEEYLEAGETGTFSANFTETWRIGGTNYEFSGRTISTPQVREQREVTRYKTHFKSIIEILLERVRKYQTSSKSGMQT